MASSNRRKQFLRLSVRTWRTVALVLAAITVGLTIWLIGMYRSAAHTITVHGQASVQLAPDTFVYRPSYQGSDAKAVVKTGNAVVARLKELGVADNEIMVSSRNSQPDGTGQTTYLITATAHGQTVAQGVTSYLVTTKSANDVTPQVSLSAGRRTQLNQEVHRRAIDDALTNARRLAGELTGGVGAVTQVVEEGSGSAAILRSTATSGQVTYTIKATFELK